MIIIERHQHFKNCHLPPHKQKQRHKLGRVNTARDEGIPKMGLARTHGGLDRAKILGMKSKWIDMIPQPARRKKNIKDIYPEV